MYTLIVQIYILLHTHTHCSLKSLILSAFPMTVSNRGFLETEDKPRVWNFGSVFYQVSYKLLYRVSSFISLNTKIMSIISIIAHGLLKCAMLPGFPEYSLQGGHTTCRGHITHREVGSYLDFCGTLKNHQSASPPTIPATCNSIVIVITSIGLTQGCPNWLTFSNQSRYWAEDGRATAIPFPRQNIMDFLSK